MGGCQLSSKSGKGGSKSECLSGFMAINEKGEGATLMKKKGLTIDDQALASNGQRQAACSFSCCHEPKATNCLQICADSLSSGPPLRSQLADRLALLAGMRGAPPWRCRPRSEASLPPSARLPLSPRSRALPMMGSVAPSLLMSPFCQWRPCAQLRHLPRQRQQRQASQGWLEGATSSSLAIFSSLCMRHLIISFALLLAAARAKLAA